MSVTAFPADATYLAKERGAPPRPCDRCGKADALPFHRYEYDRTEIPLGELFPSLAGHPVNNYLVGECSKVFLVCARCHADFHAHRRTHKHGKERRFR